MTCQDFPRLRSKNDHNLRAEQPLHVVTLSRNHFVHSIINIFFTEMKNAQSVKKHNKKQARLNGGLVVRSLKTGLEKILDPLPLLAAVRIVVVRGEDSSYLGLILSFLLILLSISRELWLPAKEATYMNCQTALSLTGLIIFSLQLIQQSHNKTQKS